MAERITNLKLKIAAAVTLGPAAVLGGQACGGGDSGAEAKFVTQTPVHIVKIEVGNPTPTAVVTKVAESATPVSGGDTSKGPGPSVEPTKAPAATPTEAPKPTVTPTEVPKSNIPAKAQEFLADLVSIKSLSPSDVDAISKGFTERDWPQAISTGTERKKYSAYMGIYQSLWSAFNATKDQVLITEMKKVEAYLSVQWPDFYAQGQQSGAFYK